MNDRIVGIAFERTRRKIPPHPRIERVVKEKIRQNRTDHAPYTKGTFEFERVVRGWRKSDAALDFRLKG